MMDQLAEIAGALPVGVISALVDRQTILTSFYYHRIQLVLESLQIT